jgi:hypothetical protein
MCYADIQFTLNFKCTPIPALCITQREAETLVEEWASHFRTKLKDEELHDVVLPLVFCLRGNEI